MIEITIGSTVFSIMSCLVFLGIGVTEKIQRPIEFHRLVEPTIRWDNKTTTVVKTRSKPKRTNGVQEAKSGMTIAQLERIKSDNYVGKKHEYNAESVERALLRAYENKATRFVSSYTRTLDDCPF